MSEPYDGIILGTGHNALVLQAYLARAGLRVLSLDRAAAAGGGLATIENPRLPGFFHNIHSFFHRAVTAMPWYRDLELERHGAVYVEPELNVALILPDGRSLEWWLDFDKTVDSVAEFSKRDAAALRRWVDEVRPMVEQLIIPEVRSPPLPPARRLELLGRSALGRRFLEVSARTPLKFVEEEFENDVVRAGLLFINGMREIDLQAPGFGHAIPALLAGRHAAQMCLGGTAQLAQALVADIREHGGEVRTGAELRAILTRQGRVVGVELAGGERIETRGFVASGLNPQQTFLDLLDADAASALVRAQAAYGVAPAPGSSHGVVDCLAGPRRGAGGRRGHDDHAGLRADRGRCRRRRCGRRGWRGAALPVGRLRPGRRGRPHRGPAHRDAAHQAAAVAAHRDLGPRRPLRQGR